MKRSLTALVIAASLTVGLLAPPAQATTTAQAFAPFAKYWSSRSGKHDVKKTRASQITSLVAVFSLLRDMERRKVPPSAFPSEIRLGLLHFVAYHDPDVVRSAMKRIEKERSGFDAHAAFVNLYGAATKSERRWLKKELPARQFAVLDQQLGVDDSGLFGSAALSSQSSDASDGDDQTGTPSREMVLLALLGLGIVGLYNARAEVIERYRQTPGLPPLPVIPGLTDVGTPQAQPPVAPEPRVVYRDRIVYRDRPQQAQVRPVQPVVDQPDPPVVPRPVAPPPPPARPVPIQPGLTTR